MHAQDFEQLAHDFLHVFWMIKNLGEADILEGCMLKLEGLALQVNNVDVIELTMLDMTNIGHLVVSLEESLFSIHKYCNRKQLRTLKQFQKRVKMMASRIKK